MINRRYARWGLIGLAILAFLLLCQFIGWRYVFFNLISENPPSSTLPSSQSTLVFIFNRDLTDKSSIKVIGTDVTHRVTVDNDTIRLIFTNTLNEGDNIAVQVKVISSDGNAIELTRQYQVKYLDFTQLPPEEQQRQTEQSDSFERGYPLIDRLPIITSDFEISYTTPDTNEKTMSLNILCKNTVIKDPLNTNIAEDTSCLPAAKQYLTDLGYNKDSYVILSELKSRDVKKTH